MTVTAVKSTCPQRDKSPAFTIVCDWLAANGIDETVPANPTFLVQDEPVHQRIVYRGFKFDDDQRGYDAQKITEGHLRLLEEDRVVPLVVPLTDDVRAAFQELENRPKQEQRCYLVETGNAAQQEAYRQRLGLPDLVSRIRYYAHDGDTRTCLSITAHDGALHFATGDDDVADEDTVVGGFVLAEKRIDDLIRDLPRLREWLKSEQRGGR